MLQVDMLPNRPHRRFNALTREWVLVSPHRAKRPWLGQVETTPTEFLPAYDPVCYLCPGNVRAAGVRNPAYASTFVFDNDFSALLPPDTEAGGLEDGGGSVPLSPLPLVSPTPLLPNPHTPTPLLPNSHTPTLPSSPSGLFVTDPAPGLCRVVCFSPRHDLTLPELPLADVEAVVAAWADQTRQLGALAFVNYVQVFENKGAIMGCSNPHPHSQVWASEHIPNEPAKELVSLTAYANQHGHCLLCDYTKEERSRTERIVAANDHFTALVPFWAVWPFEVLLLSNRHAASLTDLTAAETISLADLLRRVTIRYDNLFETSFPYSMGFHQAPTDGRPRTECHLHAHFYPPLLRSAAVKKFMVGYEMLAMPQRDLTPEAATERLRSLGEVHYRSRPSRGFG